MKAVLTLLITCLTINTANANLDTNVIKLRELKNSLSSIDFQRLKAGVTLTFTEEKTKGNFEVYAFKTIPATAEEVTAVFTDYELQKNYLPKMEVSQIVDSHDSLSDIVNYSLLISQQMNIHENYQLLCEIKPQSAGYRLDRTLTLEGERLKTFNSTVIVDDFNSSTAIVGYYSYSVLSFPLTEEQNKNNVIEILKSLTEQVKSEKSSDLSLLSQQVDKLKMRFTN